MAITINRYTPHAIHHLLRPVDHDRLLRSVYKALMMVQEERLEYRLPILEIIGDYID